jgi:hypothetical protein
MVLGLGLGGLDVGVHVCEAVAEATVLGLLVPLLSVDEALLPLVVELN